MTMATAAATMMATAAVATMPAPAAATTTSRHHPLLPQLPVVHLCHHPSAGLACSAQLQLQRSQLPQPQRQRLVQVQAHVSALLVFWSAANRVQCGR